jgi:acyl CoA:acetate/3-ketoacid CoA transferase alpha subunit
VVDFVSTAAEAVAGIADGAIVMVSGFGSMASAATTTIVQVRQMLPVGGIDPEHVVTPSIYVDRVVCIPVAGIPNPEVEP